MVMKSGSWKLCIKETVKILSKNVCILTILKQNLYEVTFAKQFFKKLIFKQRFWKEKEGTKTYPRMFTNRSSAALWIWNTSSRNRAKQELLWSASFQRFKAVASLFRIPWHKINPTSKVHIDWCHKPDAQRQ